MKFAAMVQFPGGAQWECSQVERDDGKGFTNYGIEAASFEEALAKVVELYNTAKAQSQEQPMGEDDFDFFQLFTDGELPTLVVLSCQDPREHRTMEWPK